MAGGAIFAVVIVVIVVVLVGVNKKPPAANTSTLTGAALASAVTGVTSVPASVLNQVGTGSSQVTSNPIIPVKGGTTLTSGGKPEMLFMGAEYCPYCAAERWGMIVALSRFGTFTGLQTIHSAAADGAGNAEPNPNTPTWTFANAKYTSKYLTFASVELQTNIPDPSTGSYTNLQTPTKAEQAILTKYDAAPYIPSADAGSIPFVDFGNKYMISGASYNGAVLLGKTYPQIEAALKDPTSSIAEGVDGTANYITASICKLTNNQPASACTPAVQAIESKL